MDNNYLVDKFNRGMKRGGGGGGDDDQIKRLRLELGTGIREMVTTIKNEFKALEKRVAAIEEIGKLYTVTPTYFSTHNRRIVRVAKGKDKWDAATMEQLEDVESKLGSRLTNLETELGQALVPIKGRKHYFKTRDNVNTYNLTRQHKTSD